MDWVSERGSYPIRMELFWKKKIFCYIGRLSRHTHTHTTVWWSAEVWQSSPLTQWLMNPTPGERMCCFTSTSDTDLHWNGPNERLSIVDKRNTFSICTSDCLIKTSLKLWTFETVVWSVFLFCSPGFQVVAGENSGRQDLGTLISSITPGGPADLNGCLKPGMTVERRVETRGVILKYRKK